MRAYQVITYSWYTASMRRNILGYFLLFFLLAGGTAYVLRERISTIIFRPKTSTALPGVKKQEAASPLNETQEPIQVVAENLTIPWEIAFLPDQSLLVTERPGTLIRIHPDSRQTIPISGVEHIGEGGLLGLALHPQFDQNNLLYVYLTTKEGNALSNRVEMYQFDANSNTLSNRVVLVDTIPGAQYHDGGRIAFGPDGKLYITTGDAGKADSAQDKNSLAGKILRMNENGSSLEVYSYGHRNPQGLAWDEQGRLWISEHGPSGTETGNDEINLIVQGGNYGWPEIRGTQTREGMITPVVESGRSDTWAPGDLAFLNGKVFMSGLRGQSLYSAEIERDTLKNFTAHFQQEFGRIRVVTVGPDGWLYIATSNLDGRGNRKEGDDQIVRIHPDVFN